MYSCRRPKHMTLAMLVNNTNCICKEYIPESCAIIIIITEADIEYSNHLSGEIPCMIQVCVRDSQKKDTSA